MPRIPQRFSFRWWQLALYELALFSLGAGVAGLFPDFFSAWWHIFLFIFIVIAPYILFVYLTQLTRRDPSDREETDPHDHS